MASCGFLHIDHLLKIELELTHSVDHAQKNVDVAVSSACQVFWGAKSGEKGRAIAFEIKQRITVTRKVDAILNFFKPC